MRSLSQGAFAAVVFVVLANSNGFAQTFAPTPKRAATQTPPPETAEIQALTKKIDEQNAKIDMLSQQILKLGCIDIHFHVAGTVGQARQWQQPHRCPRRNPYFHRASTQRQRERAAKIQSHR